MYTKYFHRESTKPSDVTNAFPTTMRKAPVRTSGISLPHRDMTTPATRPPIGVASDGIARRAPAVVAESSKTIWKNRGRLKRYCVERLACAVIGPRADLEHPNSLHMQTDRRRCWQTGSTPAVCPGASGGG